MKTRQEYLDGKVSHREYYSQFITPEMVQQVKRYIGIDRIKASKDEHLNDIPSKEWDALSGVSFSKHTGEILTRPRVSKEFHELCNQANERISSSTLTCVYKEIARQLIDK